MSKISETHSAEIEKKLRDYIERINQLEAKVAELNVKYNNARLELDQQRSIKKQVRTLYGSIDDKIVRTINKRGLVHNPNSKVSNYSLNSTMINTLSLEELLFEAKKYDVAQNFRYRSLKSHRKLRYRILGWVYCSARDIVFLILKRTYKLMTKIAGQRHEK